MKSLLFVGVLVASVTTCEIATADLIHVSDASFEDSSLNHGTWGNLVSPWMGSGGWVTTQGNFGLSTPVDGLQAVSANDNYQILSTTYEEGTTYILTGWTQQRLSSQVTLAFIRGDLPTFDATDSDTYLARFFGTSSQFVQQTVEYTATADDHGHAIGIGLDGAFIDAVELRTATTAVPEPTSLPALGLLALAWTGLRRRRG